MPMYDHNDNQNEYKKMVRMCVLAGSLVMMLFLLALYMNTKPKKEKEVPVLQKSETQTDEAQTESEEEDFKLGESKLTSDDLDFWYMYDDDDQKKSDAKKDQSSQSNSESSSSSSTSSSSTSSSSTSSSSSSSSSSGSSSIVSHQSDTRTAILNDDGKTEWIDIDDTIKRHSYQLEDGLQRDGELMKYIDNGKQISTVGIDVSKYQGDIDWAKVKASGVQFAMIRVGSRGYGSGQLILDENCAKNIQGAINQGIKVGVYFFSQATSKTEAVEEANFVVAAIMNYKITYPVVCDIEEIKNDTARTEKLTNEEITQYARDFCDTVKGYGYHSMIYADKKCLLTRLDLTKLSDIDIWLSQNAERPDYPYEFDMWQYSQSGIIDGINGEADMNISFVNYEEK